MGLTVRQSLQKWDDYRRNLERETPLPKETPADKEKRINRLEKDPEAWFKYHFPQYAYAEPAPFHKRATKRLIKNKRWYEARVWSRELAKSTRTMMEVLYLILVKKEVRNMIIVSHSYDNAEDLMMPYQINLESNGRLINDYGTQKGFGNWETGNIKTKGGVSIRAVGGTQSARGTKNEHARPDFLLFDDMDNDELCANPDLVRKRWLKIEQNFIPTVSVSAEYLRFVFLGNYIAPYCIMMEAVKMADYYEVINIRDKNGRSTWPQKNTEEHIDYILGKISYISREKEYYNNPITEGTVFKKMHYGKVPALEEFPFLVAYGDPSHRDSKKNDYKAVVLIGVLNHRVYVIKAYCLQTSITKMAEWYYDIRDLVDGKTSVYYYIEAGSLQKTFYEDTFMPRFRKVGEKRGTLPISPDDRPKPEKFFRIESNLEPLHSNGNLILNEEEAHNEHMKTLDEQFLALTPKLKAHDDAPDSVEGGVWIALNKLISYSATSGTYRRRKKRRR